ncbi:MAG: hypothetical protein RIB78_10125 [Gammaproteobacteria bacterium]
MRTRFAQHATHSLVCLIFLLSGCATVQPDQASSSETTTSHYIGCRNLVQSLEQTIQSNAVIDHASHRITDFPYLRSNRFLASFHDEINSELMFTSWVEQLRQLALEGWHYEVMNLDKASQQQLSQAVQSLSFDNLSTALDDCSRNLVEQELAEDKQREVLLEQVVVPDAYNLWQRTLGLYPLVSPFFKLGVLDWHEETRNTYARDRAELPVHGKLLRYVPGEETKKLAYSEVAKILGEAVAHPLGMLEPNDQYTQLLFNTYAPVFEIDTTSNNDRIGAIRLTEDLDPEVDITTPVIYQYITYTRFNENTLPQLNYMVWFPARPMSSGFDLLGGKLDGLIWRVTLLPDGKPLLYDSIHPCGCYHLLFPTQHATVITNQVGYEEPLLIPRQLTINEGQRTYLRIASNSHYIDSVDTQGSVTGNEIALTSMHKNVLRSLAAGDKRKGLYGKNGIIEQSARLERFIFWPMGITSPGAMRQAGNHATAFVGRRHFDDAFLFEPYLSINSELD